MILPASGTIADRISVAGNVYFPGYIIRGAKKNLMIEAGMNLMGPRYLKGIEKILGARDALNYLFITHSHYDHLGAAPYLKKMIPGLALGAHTRVSELLRRDSVLAMMNRMSGNHSAFFKEASSEDLTITSVEIEHPLKDCDEFDLGGLTCRVCEVPGHTKDSLAFYIPELKALFPGEAAGIPLGMQAEDVQVEFLTSLQDYIVSLEKMISLAPEIICFGHGYVLTGPDATSFLSKSHAETFRYRDLIEKYLDAVEGDVEQAVLAITRKEYDEPGTIRQERNAYIINLSAQVKHVAGLVRN